MPSLPPRGCRACGAPTTSGLYCARHAPPPRHYDTPEWRALSARMIRSRGRCERCGLRRDLQTDEIVPRSLGGTWHASNLRVLCADCHRRIGVRSDRPVPGSRNLSATPPPSSTQRVLLARREVSANLVRGTFAHLPGASAEREMVMRATPDGPTTDVRVPESARFGHQERAQNGSNTTRTWPAVASASSALEGCRG